MTTEFSIIEGIFFRLYTVLRESALLLVKMLNESSVLLLSGFLFLLGFIGLAKKPNVVKTIISIDIMLFASIVNFCYFSEDKAIKSGHFAALIAVVISGIVLSIIFTILSLQSNDRTDIDVLSEDNEVTDD